MDIEHELRAMDQARDDEHQELSDVVEAHTLSLAHIQG